MNDKPQGLMSAEALSDIAERASKATNGPWETQYGYKTSSVIVRTPKGYGRIILAQDWVPRRGVVGPIQDDAEFIAHSREDIPRLLAHIAAQDARIAELQEESDYQSYAIEVLAAALPHDAARQLLEEE